MLLSRILGHIRHNSRQLFHDLKEQLVSVQNSLKPSYLWEVSVVESEEDEQDVLNRIGTSIQHLTVISIMAVSSSPTCICY